MLFLRGEGVVFTVGPGLDTDVVFLTGLGLDTEEEFLSFFGLDGLFLFSGASFVPCILPDAI